ncbi:MAG: Gfo/Idh/MocA family oxidoreductase [Acidaminococcales bacterium]|jgi:predicted dehydrogenase|nr:Gfo/Idh/MocA family oxidoreductase [Acidaminococcales bacterium]
MARFKAAVIGLGQIGLTYDFDPGRKRPSSHVLAYMLNGDFSLVGAADPKPEREGLLRKLAGPVNFYADMEKLIAENPALDVVSVCTPPGLHLENIEFILRNAQPKVIFCEKPLVKNTEEAARLKSLLAAGGALLVPNISRRWSLGLGKIAESIKKEEFGRLQKIAARYTRGVYNTGAHLFDLLRLWAGEIKSVLIADKVQTSAEKDGDPSFSFLFETESGAKGVAEAFDDRQYYIFEIDLYFAKGKIEFRNSGNDVFYYLVKEHALFSGFSQLSLCRRDEGLFNEESLIAGAVANLAGVLRGADEPACRFGDAVYPLLVAEALERSYKNGSRRESVAQLR